MGVGVLTAWAAEAPMLREAAAQTPPGDQILATKVIFAHPPPRVAAQTSAEHPMRAKHPVESPAGWHALAAAASASACVLRAEVVAEAQAPGAAPSEWGRA